MVPEWVELPEELHKGVRGGTKKHRERLPRLLGDDLVEIDADQIRQVLINLIKNACETESHSCRVEISLSDGKVIIAVEDNGPGFPDKLVSDGPVPYFSTKERGSQKGMGLGLSTAYSIIKT